MNKNKKNKKSATPLSPTLINKKKKKYRSFLIGIICALVAVAVVVCTYFIQTSGNKPSLDLEEEELQAIVDFTIADLPRATCKGSVYVAENTKVNVESFSYGPKKSIILNCTYETIDVKTVVENNLEYIVQTAYETYITAPNGSRSEGYIMAKTTKAFNELIKDAKPVSGDITITLYEIGKRDFKPHLSDEFINTVYGGLLDSQKMIESTNSIIYNGKSSAKCTECGGTVECTNCGASVEHSGEKIDLTNNGTVRKGAAAFFALDNYDSKVPDTSVPIEKAWNSIKYDFYRNFIEKDRYMTIVKGLFTTLEISALAALLGIILGFIIAVIRCINQKTEKIGFLSGICKTYISVMRGTPLVVQLLIMHYIILSPLNLDEFYVAVLCFGLNSGAYVSEIVRGGIMSIDDGQTEAGRSLGFNYIQTMWYIIIPQAFKAVLPSLANEFITLLKETSVAFVISVADLSNAGDRIRAATFSPFMPLIAVAVIYLILVLGLSKLVAILERRLAKSDRR